MEQLGVLQISTRGTRRFRIDSLRPESNGLLRASIDEVEEESATLVPSQFSACAQLLERIIEKINQEGSDSESAGKAPIAAPYHLEDASWVGNRLCEILPISLAAKQKLMELTDAPTRLSIVHQYLQQQKII